jgi:hypothetical protein
VDHLGGLSLRADPEIAENMIGEYGLKIFPASEEPFHIHHKVIVRIQWLLHEEFSFEECS